MLEVEDCMRMLVDTSTTMNTDNKNYYLRVTLQCPVMVVEYLQNWSKH